MSSCWKAKIGWDAIKVLFEFNLFIRTVDKCYSNHT